MYGKRVPLNGINHRTLLLAEELGLIEILGVVRRALKIRSFQK